MENRERIFMKPGRTNQEDRDNFIKFWANYMKSVPDKTWGEQQNLLINSQLKNADHKTYLKLHKLKKVNPS